MKFYSYSSLLRLISFHETSLIDFVFLIDFFTVRLFFIDILVVDFQGAMNGSDEVNKMDFKFSYEEKGS